MITNVTLLGTSASADGAQHDAFGIDHELDDPWRSFSRGMALSQRIECEIGNGFSLLVNLAEAPKSFENRERYRRFLEAQFVMHSSVRALYDDPLVRRQFPQLTATDSIAQIVLDLADLGINQPYWSGGIRCLPSGFMNRLGWFYIAETLIRAFANWSRFAREFQLSENFGARHLAPRVDRAYRWLLLTEAFDDLCLSEVDEERIFAGARSAIRLLTKLMRDAHVSRHLNQVELVQ